MTSQNSRNTAEVGEQESQALVDKKSEKPDALPGPSTNPATNLLIADIVMRGVGRAVRKSLHKSVLRTGYSRDKAKEIVEDRSVVRTLALYGATRFATRSTPGALLVGGGLLVKSLYDRGVSRREAKRRANAETEIEEK